MPKVGGRRARGGRLAVNMTMKTILSEERLQIAMLTSQEKNNRLTNQKVPRAATHADAAAANERT